MNKRTLEEQIIEELAPIKITSYAIRKANVISERICELAGRSLEVGFYMLDDPPEENKEVVIRDIYIGHEQNVRSAHCDITSLGKVKSVKDIRKMGKRIVGWGHSHAAMSTFYSGEDDNTILETVQKWGIKSALECTMKLNGDKADSTYVSEDDQKGILLELDGQTIFISSGMFHDHSEDYNHRQSFDIFRNENIIVPYFYGMTFNARGDEPHCVLAYMVDGKARKVERGVTYEIVDEGGRVYKKEIDEQLIDRVIELRHLRKKGPVVKREFKELKTSYRDGARALVRLDTEDIEDEERALIKLYESFNTGRDTNKKYNSDGVYIMENSTVEKYAPKIKEIWKALLGRVEEKKEFLEERIESLGEYKDTLGSHRIDLRKKVVAMRDMYREILDTVGEYNGTDN